MGKRLAAALALVVIALALCGGVEEKSGAPAGAEGTLLIVDADVQTLSLYEDGRHVKTYPCAVGARDTPTPLGVFRITGKAADWGGGFGSGLDPDDWFWYTNGVHTIHVARTAPPPKGYTRTDPPKNYHTGGGSSRGGGVGRHNSGCASSCACACASSCACACACAGGGRAGCTAKDFYTYKLPHKADREDDQ